ncbi:multiple sugar transport system permease protein [Nocardioides terrae]|uniref:Multiple sugar transport system permease protein n=1 Tax=Nocardioides terrae TaxID=574651 RepID=A0A1I1KL74_9ACTN|nr:carbohydrate ABC transporter permease [Nocardioides terrae]SFC58170.1 multiple sugar transport system permease protein [Nocardioides terrae]
MSLQRPSTAVRTGQYVALLGYVVFLGFPLIWLLSTALKSTKEIALGSIRLIPDAPTLDNFSAAVAKANLWQAGFNSLVVAVATTVLTVVIALPAAYGLARYRTILRPITLGWVLVSQMFPTILVIIPLFMILKTLHLLDQLPGLVVVYVVYVLPFCLWMLFGFVQTVPPDIEEAAAIDGAGRIRTLVSIVLPLLRPGIVATALFAFISSWNEFMFALVLIQTPDKVTLPLTLSRFVGAEGQVQLGPLAAAALLATIPSLVFFALIQRRLSGGLLSGAVKG